MCDNASEFLRIRGVCEKLGVQFNPTHLGRPEVKGRQESAVKVAKLMIRWCVETAKEQMDELEFQGHHLVKTAQFLLNIRASPRRKLIPWHVSYRTRPRLDLHVFTPVRLVRTSRILIDESKCDVVLYLGQLDPQTGIFCHPGSLKIQTAHISKFRSAKIPVSNFIALFERPLTLGALSTTTRKLIDFDRRSPEWKQAVLEHAERLVSYNAFTKVPDQPTTRPGNSFFTGRIVDGAPKARLVANGALHSDDPVDSYLPLAHERFLFLARAAQRLRDGYSLYGGDISGAYYNTPGEGFLRLPKNWPIGCGGFNPSEIVALNCAIPGDTLSSGLFLQTLATLFTNNGFENLFGATYKTTDDKILLIHFSDDVLISCRDEDVKWVEDCIKTRFEIKFTRVERWVSMELDMGDDTILVRTQQTATGMVSTPSRFKIGAFER